MSNNPSSKFSMNDCGYSIQGDTTFLGCTYNLFLSDCLSFTFTPQKIAPGGSSVIQLWIVQNVYEYDEELDPSLQRTIYVNPDYGNIVRIGNGKYLFTASDTLTADSNFAVIQYKNFTNGCAGWDKDSSLHRIEPTKSVSADGCIYCPPFLWTTLWCDEGVDSLLIGYDSLSVTISPSVVYPGDTADVVIKKKLRDGTLVDFDSTQTFEVAKLEGCIWGNLLVGDTLRSYFYDVRQPIKFVADTSAIVIDSLVSDTGHILISVGIIDPDNKAKHHPQPLDVTDCFTGSLLEQNMKVAEAAEQNPLEIISPTPGDTNWISKSPQMPDINCKAIMHGDYFWEEVNFDWEFVIKDSISRHSHFRPDTLCPRIGMLKFVGSSTANYSDTTFWDILFNVSNIDPNSVYFKALQPTIPHDESYGGNCDAVINSWDEGEDILVGGIDSVKVIARNGNGKIVGINQLKIGYILGENPEQDSIRAYANSNELYAIIKHESNVPGAVGLQFNSHNNGLRYKTWYLDGAKYNRKGYPVYGPPNGFGLTQIDNPPATEMDLWNWHHTIDSGRDRWNSAKYSAMNYINNKGATYIDSVFYMNAYQRYNGGRYWDWDGHEWIPTPGKHTYGRQVYLIYLELNQNYNKELK